MIRSWPSLLLPIATLGAAVTAAGTADAQSTVTISMAAPPAAPRLLGPLAFGAYPGSPLLFAIPATGQAPLTFAATGLPNGVSIAAGTGILSGATPAKGSYPIEVSVTSAAGSAKATYTLVSGDTLSLTPAMGWNSYDSFGASVTEQDMIDQGGAVRAQLQPYGWNYVVIDYRWYEPGQPIDANGRYVPATSKYPSATGSVGFKSLSDRIHALGLAFGIHIMRGIPRKSYDADLPIADANYTTKDAGNPNDPCPWDQHMWGVRGDMPAGQAWYDSLFKQYAAWGVDFVKIDDMLNNDTKVFHQAEADAIRLAVGKTGRAIALSFSPGPNEPSWLPNAAANLNKNANMWRVVNDFWDYNALTDLPGVFKAAASWSAVGGLTPGHWADLDMLPLGYLGPRNEWHASGDTTFSKNEQVTIMSLWTLLPSPLMFGGNPARLASDAWTRALLTNEEILAVNQDVLGARGKRTAVTAGEMWVRELSGGRKAVGFFNRGAQDAMMSASFADLGVTGTPVIRDLWRRADVPAAGNGLAVSVPGGAALVYTVSPPGSGGGTGGAGGTGAMGGASAGGGAAGGDASSGGGASGGVSGSAGSASGGTRAGGVAGTGAGGSPGSGGNGLAAAGTGAGTASPAAGESGCGCALARRGLGSGALALLLGLGALGTGRRRARRRASDSVR
jgi:alpha-galactosidase